MHVLLYTGEYPNYCTSSYIKVIPTYFGHYIWPSSGSAKSTNPYVMGETRRRKLYI